MIDLTHGDKAGYDLVVEDVYEDAVLIYATKREDGTERALCDFPVMQLTREQAGELIDALDVNFRQNETYQATLADYKRLGAWNAPAARKEVAQ